MWQWHVKTIVKVFIYTFYYNFLGQPVSVLFGKRVDSEGRELIQEGFVMSLRLSGELAECEGNSPAVRIQTMNSHQLCEQIGRSAKGTINDKMRSLS